MSRTTTFALYKTKVTAIAEHRNGHGSGPAIWDYASLKALGKKMDLFNSDGFWSCWKSPLLDDDEKAVLLFTYDDAFVEFEHLEKFASACRKVHDRIIERSDWTWNHFAAIADDADKIRGKKDRRCRGMVVQCTSVADNWEGDIKKLSPWGVYEAIAAAKEES